MKAFTVKVGNKILDYRLGQNVDLKKFQKHLLDKGYTVEKLWKEKRHAVGELKKEDRKLFVKLATSEGMSIFSKNEFEWNKQFNERLPRSKSNFWVPENLSSGYFENLFYFVTDFGQGQKISNHQPNTSNFLDETLIKVIEFSEVIQSLKFSGLDPNEFSKGLNHQEWFVEKTNQWFEGIPRDVVNKYGINELIKTVRNGANQLEAKPRHGDFTPWHIFKLKTEKLYLFDAEHALSSGVQYYDISYFIQRVFSVLENRSLAEEILEKLRQRKYDFGKLRTVLATRAIGGFLDRSFYKTPDYKLDADFKSLVINLR